MKLIRHFPCALSVYLSGGFLSVSSLFSPREDRDHHNILLALLASKELYRIYTLHVLKHN